LTNESHHQRKKETQKDKKKNRQQLEAFGLQNKRGGKTRKHLQKKNLGVSLKERDQRRVNKRSAVTGSLSPASALTGNEGRSNLPPDQLRGGKVGGKKNQEKSSGGKHIPLTEGENKSGNDFVQQKGIPRTRRSVTTPAKTHRKPIATNARMFMGYALAPRQNMRNAALSWMPQ